jgi:hypothetical protein
MIQLPKKESKAFESHAGTEIKCNLTTSFEYLEEMDKKPTNARP